jgi:uncharacterized membrane protein
VHAHDDDQLVAGYLRQLSTAASALPADRKAELIEEITVHIAEARAAGSGGSSDVRNILERLGDPADIVRAAADPPFGDFAAHGPVTDNLVSDGRAVAGRRAAGGRAGALEVAAVLFLLIGGIVLPVIGWVIGVVLLWASPRWRTADKLLGTFVWPGGLLAPAGVLLVGGGLAVSTSSSCQPPVGAPVAESIGEAGTGPTQQTVHQVAQAAACTTSGGTPGWLVIVLAGAVMAVAVAGPILVAIRLLRRAARPPAEPAAGASALQTV